MNRREEARLTRLRGERGELLDLTKRLWSLVKRSDVPPELALEVETLRVAVARVTGATETQREARREFPSMFPSRTLEI